MSDQKRQQEDKQFKPQDEKKAELSPKEQKRREAEIDSDEPGAQRSEGGNMGG